MGQIANLLTGVGGGGAGAGRENRKESNMPIEENRREDQQIQLVPPQPQSRGQPNQPDQPLEEFTPEEGEPRQEDYPVEREPSREPPTIPREPEIGGLADDDNEDDYEEPPTERLPEDTRPRFNDRPEPDDYDLEYDDWLTTPRTIGRQTDLARNIQPTVERGKQNFTAENSERVVNDRASINLPRRGYSSIDAPVTGTGRLAPVPGRSQIVARSAIENRPTPNIRSDWGGFARSNREGLLRTAPPRVVSTQELLQERAIREGTQGQGYWLGERQGMIRLGQSRNMEEFVARNGRSALGHAGGGDVRPYFNRYVPNQSTPPPTDQWWSRDRPLQSRVVPRSVGRAAQNLPYDSEAALNSQEMTSLGSGLRSGLGGATDELAMQAVSGAAEGAAAGATLAEVGEAVALL